MKNKILIIPRYYGHINRVRISFTHTHTQLRAITCAQLLKRLAHRVNNNCAKFDEIIIRMNAGEPWWCTRWWSFEIVRLVTKRKDIRVQLKPPKIIRRGWKIFTKNVNRIARHRATSTDIKNQGGRLDTFSTEIPIDSEREQTMSKYKQAWTEHPPPPLHYNKLNRRLGGGIYILCALINDATNSATRI